MRRAHLRLRREGPVGRAQGGGGAVTVLPRPFQVGQSGPGGPRAVKKQGLSPSRAGPSTPGQSRGGSLGPAGRAARPGGGGGRRRRRPSEPACSWKGSTPPAARASGGGLFSRRASRGRRAFARGISPGIQVSNTGEIGRHRRDDIEHRRDWPQGRGYRTQGGSAAGRHCRPASPTASVAGRSIGSRPTSPAPAPKRSPRPSRRCRRGGARRPLLATRAHSPKSSFSC